MTYGVIIDGVNTKTEYGLILCADLSISKPDPKTHYVSVPEMNGALDLTESLTGTVTYGQRNITFNLFAAADVLGGTETPPDEHNFAIMISRFSEYVHGKRRKIFFPDDTEFGYEGRFTVGARGSYHSGLVPVKMVADAYKVKDPQTKDLSTSGTYTVENSGEEIYPVFTFSGTGTASVTINGETVSLLPGETLSTVPLRPGSNTVISSTSAALTMGYQERRL